MRDKLVLYLVGFCLACQGCNPLGRAVRTSIVQPLIYPRWLNDLTECKRNHKMADSAWAQYCGSGTGAYSKDFEKGFKEGFSDFLFWGGTGAPPPVPPRCYWNARYETPEGHKAIEDWFAGFRVGAASARETGYRKLIVVPASTTLPPLLQPPSLPSAPVPPPVGPGRDSGNTLNPEEMLPPPKPVPTPASPSPQGQPQSAPNLPKVPAPGPEGAALPSTGPEHAIQDVPKLPLPEPQSALPAPEPVSQTVNPSVAELRAPQALPERPPRPAELDNEQLLKMLRESWDPLQREWAAEQLARQDLRYHPPLCRALAVTAQEDPTALVQAVCRRLLTEAGEPSPAGPPLPRSSAPAARHEAPPPGPTYGTITEE